jgi:hypothetical protein
LYIADEVPEHPKAKIFEPQAHSFNLFKVDRKTARDLARALYTISPQGDNTLTVRNGGRALAQALSKWKRFDQLEVESKLKGIGQSWERMTRSLSHFF